MSAERIGSLLANLARAESGAGEGYAENTRCGGALLYVSRDQAIGMARKGFRWVLDPETLPEDGRQSFRVACSGEATYSMRHADLPPDATPEERAASARKVQYALCTRCNGYELGMRQKLAKEAKEAAEKAKPMGGRRRGFAEDVSE